METVTKEEWDKLTKTDDAIQKKFTELFTIACKKCGSDDVEIFGESDSSNVYYEYDEKSTFIVIKCHRCGNAKRFDLDNVWKNDILKDSACVSVKKVE